MSSGFVYTSRKVSASTSAKQKLGTAYTAKVKISDLDPAQQTAVRKRFWGLLDEDALKKDILGEDCNA